MMMKAGELVLIDTNILLSAADTSRPAYSTARSLFRRYERSHLFTSRRRVSIELSSLYRSVKALR